MHPIIAGLGLQTALGTSVDSTWSALLAGRFITDHSRVPVDVAPGTSRITALAIAAALESVSDAGMEPAELRDSDMPLIVGTSKGPIEQWMPEFPPQLTLLQREKPSRVILPPSVLRGRAAQTRKMEFGDSKHVSTCDPERSEGPLLSRNEETLRCAQGDGLKPSVYFQSSTDGGSNALECPSSSRGEAAASHTGLQPSGLGDLAVEIARRLGLVGPRLTLSAACASGLHALIRGALLIRAGEARRVLVVAAESSLHALFIGNFDRLGVLPPSGFGCRPFDRDRRGFVMSEAAAAVVLEAPGAQRQAAASRRPVAVERFAFAGDATHLTGSDPRAKTLRQVLARVIDGRGIHLAHAHGTGTKVNDAVELSALEATLPPGGAEPALYSHKGALGHSLGASGLVSVVLNCMSHQTSIIPGNVRTTEPLESSRVEISQEPTERRVDRSLAIAAGFGGAIAAVSLGSL